MKTAEKILILFFLVFSSTNLFYAGSIRTHNLFGDNMVFQQGSELLVWGWGEPGKNIKINFHNQTKSTSVNFNGEWQVKLKSENYGGPYELKIICGDTLLFKNVMVGEVWLCSGQSNMTMPLGGWGRVLNYNEEINNADYSNIRLATIPLTLAESPRKNVDVDGWYECSPQTVENFSAVAYFFARELFAKYNIPIGIIHVSKGGTPAESWMSEKALNDFPEFAEDIQFVKNGSSAEFVKMEMIYKQNFNDWLDTIYNYDAGYSPGSEWYKLNTDYKSWKKMLIPDVWENAGLKDYDGVVWFNRTIEIPDDWIDQQLILCLSSVQDYDITYFNGQKVGEQKKSNYLSEYSIPKGFVRNGNNSITVRVLDQYGNGGLWGRPEEMYMKNEKGEMISITGEWNYKPSVEFSKINKLPPERLLLDRKPTILFNGMIYPLIGFSFKGVIWYQGESNAERAAQYRDLFPALIKDWRVNMSLGDFPFMFVQLANYNAKAELPEESSWAELREAQSMALNLPNTAMAVTIDIGNNVDVHPINKQEIGKRLALLAMSKIFGENIVCSGPVYKSMEIFGDKIVIEFDSTGSDLMIKGNEKLLGFIIAGEDKKFYNAQALLDKNSVVVSSINVPNPVAVRYAWASNPECNLYNTGGLPAAPFRSDNWPGVTSNKNK
ncbi:MAG: 9-O-acetylesterase [Ignavibacteriae bacterium HGW-Ignavibacteriae-2]|nr:MAG: 9-O-acetylesterase [Ignavibacteriae bacterium HGW-Ignavibacteriae-2]